MSKNDAAGPRATTAPTLPEDTSAAGAHAAGHPFVVKVMAQEGRAEEHAGLPPGRASSAVAEVPAEPPVAAVSDDGQESAADRAEAELKAARRELRKARRKAARNQSQNKRGKRLQKNKFNVAPRKAGAPTIPLMPTAPAATRKKRHVGVLASFVLAVVLPCLVVGGYLYVKAADQYASSMGFSVRKEDSASASEMIGGILEFGGGGGSDSDILYEYIQSQALVQKVDEKIDLREVYSKPEGDWYFSLSPDAPIEEVLRYWQRMVTIYYDTGSGLIETRVLAFTPEDAQRVSQAILDESSDTINRLTSIARDDTTRYARDELALAQTRLREARAALTEFRARTQIVDPTIDVQGQMGLLSTLQAQLANALIELDLLRDNTRAEDPRIRQAEQRIVVIERRIEDERSKIGIGAQGQGDPDFASLVGEYESLTVDREFAEQTYLVAQANFDAAQAEAQRKSRYLAAYTYPTLAESSEYPKRLTLLSVFALFSIGAWSVGALIYYSIRDRR